MNRARQVLLGLALCLAVAGCGDRPGRDLTQPVQAQQVGSASGLLTQLQSLLPPNAVGIRRAVLASFSAMQQSLATGNRGQARDQMLTLVDLLLQAHAADRLADPDGAEALTATSGTCDLVDALFANVGLTQPGLCNGALGSDGGAVAVVTHHPTVITTPDSQAGVSIPTGAFRHALIVIRRLPDPRQHGRGPLYTNFAQYPRFFEYSVIPQLPFNVPVLVGVCVYDPPNPLAPTPEVAARLLLAHNRGSTIELLSPATPTFLACTPSDVDSDMPGGIGGLAGSFSPFGAVDTARTLP